MRTHLVFFTVGTALAASACSRPCGHDSTTPVTPRPTSEASTPAEPSASEAIVVLASEVEWEDLNPARGDQSPRAGTLWGDRKGSVATGYLLRPVDGFRSPPHIHNVSYRAVVIRGVLHNDDPAAADLWMTPGSFWTQPKGEVHITAAKGQDTLAYIEIDEGPYLVHPPDQAFVTGERPINVHTSNIVWVDAARNRDAGQSKSELQLAYLWGDPSGQALHGLFARLGPGKTAVVRSTGPELRAITVKGVIDLELAGRDEPISISPGGYFGSRGAAHHPITCTGDSDCIVYLRGGAGLTVQRGRP